MDGQVKILCVDDEMNVLRALRRLFLDDDFIILTAGSAEEGLEILRSDGEIRIVVSDYRMPGMNGVDFLREVCKNWPDTERIVLSGYADTAAVVEAINVGEIYKFIPKPWNDDELRVTIHKAMERSLLRKKNLQLMEELKTSNEKLRKINENLEGAVDKALKEAFPEQVRRICKSLLCSVPMGILGIDGEGRVLHCNETAAEFLKVPAEALKGRPWTEVLPEMFRPFVEKLTAEGVLSEYDPIGGRRGWIKGSTVDLEHRQGLVLVFDWEPEVLPGISGEGQ